MRQGVIVARLHRLTALRSEPLGFGDMRGMLALFLGALGLQYGLIYLHGEELGGFSGIG